MKENIFKNSLYFLYIIPQQIGSKLLNLSKLAGSYAIFCLEAISGLFKFPLNFKLIWNQFLFIGFYSLPVVGMTAFFSGAVLALQTYTGFSRFSAESSIASVVVLSMTRELGPVLASLMVAGRVGAAIAAEIGTMKVTEQIDALYTLSTDPIKYLVTPKIFAAVISMPLLVLIADIIGVMGGYLVAVHKLDFNAAAYIDNTLKFLQAEDVISGLIKASVFGFVISSVSCYNGFNSSGGARGVGRSTTMAVVASSVLILISNYIITELLFSR